MSRLQGYEARMSMTLVECELRDLDRRIRRLKRTMQRLLAPRRGSARPPHRRPLQLVEIVE